jgi:hypothetical protein
MKKDRKESTDNRNGIPTKVYTGGLREQDSDLSGADEKTNLIDLAKVERAISGSGQKMDSVHPDDLEETRNDRIIEEERSDD